MKRIIVISLMLSTLLMGGQIYRYGSTAVNFLEIGMGSAPSAMGEAYVAMTGDLSSVYWNPAGIAYLDRNECTFMYQPWVVDINTSFVSSAFKVPSVGTFALSLTQVGYGNMKVTTLQFQDGTGEFFTANEMAAGLTFARKLATWFSFGATGKLITSQIHHMNASAFALDLGVIVNTESMSPTHSKDDGLTIGMSISNYGSRLSYDGIDLLQPIDITIYEDGNYGDVPGQFRVQSWELPLLFRIGVKMNPINTQSQRLTLAVDALHPNNNTESVNTGLEYMLKIPNAGKFYLRTGYKALFMDESQFGLTGGGGIELFLMGNKSVKVDYAFKDIGLLGRTHAYTLGLTF